MTELAVKRLDKFINQSDGLIARELAPNSKIQWDQLIPMITDVSQEDEDEWDKECDITQFCNSACYYSRPTK